MIRLRPYQEEAVEAVEQSTAARPMVVLPTGTGKTVIFAEIIRKRKGRALVLAHRDELLSQAEEKIRAVWPEVPDLGRVQADRNEVSAHVVMGSVQTLAQAHRLQQLIFASDFRTVIVDEAHHAAATSYQRILRELSLTLTGPRIIGFTATPERTDKKNLAETFDQVVYSKSLLQMIGAGYLCDLRAQRVTLTLSLAGVQSRGGDYDAGELGHVLEKAHAPEHTVSAYELWARERKKGLVFCPTVELAQATAAKFREAGIRSVAVWGGMPHAARTQALTDFTSGRYRVLVNCAVLLEGYDEPAIDCIVIARPTLSRVLYQQMLGRGTRLWMGKRDCLVLDMVGATDLQTYTLATLIGIKEETAEKGLLALLHAVKGGASAEELIADGDLDAKAVEIVDRARLSWIHDPAPSGTRYLLPAGNETLVLTPWEGAWAIRSIPRDRDGQSRLLYRDLTVEYAQGVAEDYVRRMGAWNLAASDARWRRDEPTEAQIRILQKRRLPVPLTKGEASDLISREFTKYRR